MRLNGEWDSMEASLSAPDIQDNQPVSSTAIGEANRFKGGKGIARQYQLGVCHCPGVDSSDGDKEPSAVCRVSCELAHSLNWSELAVMHCTCGAAAVLHLRCSGIRSDSEYAGMTEKTDMTRAGITW